MRSCDQNDDREIKRNIPYFEPILKKFLIFTIIFSFV